MNETDPREPAPVQDRQPWQPLHYEKIAAADAEATFIGIGTDNISYS
jgi:hypothetical protein